MWTYCQSTGQIFQDAVEKGVGYSGKGNCKNKCEKEQVHNFGPIPRGLYRMTRLVQSTEEHGPYVIVLSPDKDNTMYGRGGFLIHGDNRTGDASEGCIILNRKIRELIWTSEDRELEVVAEVPA